MLLIPTLGVASCLGGARQNCALGPALLRKSSFQSFLKQRQIQLDWNDILKEPQENTQLSTLDALQAVSRSLAEFTEHYVKKGQCFLVLSGEHSSAIGTWGGVMNALHNSSKTFGLIWLDAHLDAHTLQTSPSGNVHGMPLSVLLGKSEKSLQHTYPGINLIQGRDLLLCGARSYEAEEQKLLQLAGATIIYKPEFPPSLDRILNVIQDFVLRHDIIGVSLDLDLISPEDAPAVETPAAGGMKADKLIECLKSVKWDNKLCGVEITEFYPPLDQERRTEELIFKIIEALFSPMAAQIMPP